jgi:hypothetical protein
MKPTAIVFAWLAILGAGLPSGAADLTKIERTIAREPAYAARPYYALLAFGPEAARRVWLVLDGEVLYVDRNGNGDLTEAGERVELDVQATREIKVAPGEYKGMNVFNLGEVAGMRLRLEAWVRDESYIPRDDEPEILKEYRKERRENGWENASLYRLTEDGGAQIPVVLCPRAGDAQISHLGGPLTFQVKWGDRQRLHRGSAEGILDVLIGTPGVPTRNFRHAIFSPLTTGEVPADVHPVAHIEFPNREAGRPPIKLQVTLDKRC